VAERPEIKPGGVPFEEAARFFRDKVRLPTKKWTDIREGMHARAFVVAGAAKDELLKDLQGAIQKAIDDGTGLRQFRKEFDQIVARHGWTGWTGEGSRKGRAWRTRVIFETNLSTARAAGRWEQIQRVKGRRPWLRYVAILDDHVRPDHRRWHGTVLPVDDEWWKTHYPPNGWNCRCTVMSLSKMQLDDFGYEPSKAPPREELVRKPDPFRGGTLALDRGIDPGFNYNVGEAHVGLEREIPEGWDRTRSEWKPVEGAAYRAFRPKDYEAGPLTPRPAPALGAPATNREETIDAIRRELGGDRVTLATPDGAPVSIDAEILGRHIQPQRTVWLPVLRDLVEKPDEVWLLFERNERTGQIALRRRHLALYDLPEFDRPLLLVLQAIRGMFEAWTFVPVERPAYLERQRRGVRLWPVGKPIR
jgi:SPP1 gp7 family putative phage head morphogenesis protein